MARLTVEEQLDFAIKDAALNGDPDAPSRLVAEELYEREPVLIEHFSRGWIIEKLAGLVRLRRAKARPVDQAQMVLGFTGLPRQISLRSGKKAPFLDATLRQLRQHRAALYKRKSPALEHIDQVIRLMEKYVRDNPGIKVAQVFALEAATAAGKARS